MRLGKEQAAGYVEDVEVAVGTELVISDSERAPVTAEQAPAAVAG